MEGGTVAGGTVAGGDVGSDESAWPLVAPAPAAGLVPTALASAAPVDEPLAREAGEPGPDIAGACSHDCWPARLVGGKLVAGIAGRCVSERFW